MAKKVVITLTFEAQNICAKQGEIDEEGIVANTDISDDNNGCSPGGQKLKDFQSLVYLGYEVEWKAKVKNQVDPIAPYMVQIVKVEKKPGTVIDFFDTDPMYPDTNGKVAGTVKNNSDLLDMIYKYNVTISVYEAGNTDPCKTYVVDPKLQANN